ncbi:MAG: UDP-N-acetylglucosamine 1-carboxyvinyltransferase [Bacteroidetes bacterium]|nr:UDP-N-acetylglucosamine 1-carboxyvinyltransferase [Bacteroidota bacterium]MCL5739249.1 UDP-N-acetylglucosamine 1-carboxyvinyltransferase [Bacteroidota bacterium]
MYKFVINGGKRLSGNVVISGAKNASLALMPATLLAPGTFRIDNTPDLRDVSTMSQLMETLGARVSLNGKLQTIDTRGVNNFEAPYELVKKMRASIYVLGPLLARYGYAKVSMPGGCAWGPRPVNLHIEGMEKLGAEVTLDSGYIIARAKRLNGARINFDVSSVGATGNVMMAAVLAKGMTVIGNAALEPEIVALGEFLKRMGARIDGLGTSTVTIEGVDELHRSDFKNIPDRIEAGTFLVAGAMAGGKIKVADCEPSHISSLLSKLEEAGAKISTDKDSVTIEAPDKILPVDISTAPYPGFPTDMQAQWIALMSRSVGSSVITETIYFDRFKHVPELLRLGADVEVKENVAIVKGVRFLKAAKVMSTDLRASASLILAGLVAEGTTEVLRVYHMDRGYERIEEKLRGLGADIERVQSDEF